MLSTKTKKRIVRTIKVVAVLYVVIGILLWQFQDLLLFHAKELPQNYKFQFSIPHKEVVLQLTETENLNLIQFLLKDSTPIKGIVLYFHGNRENINRYAKYVPNFTKHGYEVWMLDYPGYGKSRGKRKEERFYTDASAIYKLAANKVSGDSIIIYGKSLGTGVATELASRVGCKKLLLETPYYSMASLAAAHVLIYPTENMVNYKFPLFEFITEVKSPITIFHGTGDDVIPYKNAVRLKKLLKKMDLFVTIPKGEHNNLNDFELYHQKLDSLLQ
jgi:uncharacterized protein